ncbi:dihydropteroate synthase [Loigolactobacillus backii]|uniref:dihydropteroate synthase n=1 Tax=Loigolactobacillus backii TaxID=375175 RepID=UPI000B00C2B2|nr:dihydropteroate synthase [Loigolactobacillus backii]MDA5388027.1 dihydropteroate synthase [Loigolactobacillus backii]MDA5390526.1 dihydropteroate synthase [Loigolactobacillus backii]
MEIKLVPAKVRQQLFAPNFLAQLKADMILLEVGAGQGWQTTAIKTFNQLGRVAAFRHKQREFLVVNKYWLYQVHVTSESLSAYQTALLAIGRELKQAKQFKARQFTIDTQAQTSVYGILNITDDSFSDGGQYFTTEKAVARAKEMVAQGAAVIELGGQSTRQSYNEISADEELRRILPVLKAIRNTINVPIAVDTYKYQVVAGVLAAGAAIINDVRPVTAEILNAVVQANAGLIIMHTQNTTHYQDLITDIHQYFANTIQTAIKAGLTRQQLMIDVGLGGDFGKTYEQEYTLLHNLDAFNDLGVATLIAPSRKGFIGKLLNLPVSERLVPTMALFANSTSLDVNFMRAHDVEETRQTLTIIDKVKRSFAY